MVFSLFSGSTPADVYVDLGTANTLVAVRGKGVVVNEPSLIAYSIGEHGKRKIVAVGTLAQEKIIKTPGNLFPARPLKEGVIADYETTETMLRHFLTRPGVMGWLTKPKVIISIPRGVTEIEKQAVIEAAKAAGAREVLLIDEPMAAAIGAGLPIQEPKGNMLIDFGGGTTEVAIIALSDIVYCSSVRVGGHRLDEDIREYAKRTKNLIISEFTAEQLKIKIGASLPHKNGQTLKVTGRNAANGLLAEAEFTSEDIYLAMHDSLNEIMVAIKKALENTPPELIGDIIENGVVLTGGGALLKDIDLRIQNEIKIAVRRAESPLTTIARGGEALLSNQNLLASVQLDASI